MVECKNNYEIKMKNFIYNRIFPLIITRSQAEKAYDTLFSLIIAKLDEECYRTTGISKYERDYFATIPQNTVQPRNMDSKEDMLKMNTIKIMRWNAVTAISSVIDNSIFQPSAEIRSTVEKYLDIFESRKKAQLDEIFKDKNFVWKKDFDAKSPAELIRKYFKKTKGFPFVAMIRKDIDVIAIKMYKSVHKKIKNGYSNDEQFIKSICDALLVMDKYDDNTFKSFFNQFFSDNKPNAQDFIEKKWIQKEYRGLKQKDEKVQKSINQVKEKEIEK